MILVIVLIESPSLYLLCQTSFQQQKERLVDTVTSQSRLIESIARYTASHNQSALPGEASAATLSQVMDAMGSYPGIGKTGEGYWGERKVM